MKCFLSPKSLALPSLPKAVRTIGKRLMSSGESSATDSFPVVVVFASELAGNTVGLPEWARSGNTRYLLVFDIPDSVLPRAMSALDLRRPDLRLHATRDSGAVQRFLVSAARREPMLGIVDAYLWNGSLRIVTGDFEFRDFPIGRVPVVSELTPDEQSRFEIDPDGSYLCWPAGDIRLGVSQILQDADPMYLADIAIERNAQDQTGAALRRIRVAKGLRQSDIPDLSERQVRRVEEGISRLRAPTAQKFATAFSMELGALLDEVARRAGDLRRTKTAAAADALLAEQP